MTDREKIIETLRASGYGYFITHEITNADEALADAADALIDAGIGDVSELKKHRVVVEKSLIPEDDNTYVLPNTPIRVKQLYSGEEVEQIVKERDEYKHRAEVAERALEIACYDKARTYCPNDDWDCIAKHFKNDYVQRAEREIAEEERK